MPMGITWTPCQMAGMSPRVCHLSPFDFESFHDLILNCRYIPCDNLCNGYCEGYGHVMNDGSNTCQGGGEHPNHYLSTFGMPMLVNTINYTLIYIISQSIFFTCFSLKLFTRDKRQLMAEVQHYMVSGHVHG